MKAIIPLILVLCSVDRTSAEEQKESRRYENKLTLLKDAPPLLADHPEFIEPIKETTRYEAPLLVDDVNADLHVRAWRFSYNARGIIEAPNRLRASQTAIIMVHPWGIDDGQGWKTPEPAGVCDFCTPAKNHLAARHTREVINPFLKSLRGRAAFIMFSLPGKEDAIRRKIYRSVSGKPSEEDRKIGAKELKAKLSRLRLQRTETQRRDRSLERQTGRRLLQSVSRPRSRPTLQQRRLLEPSHSGDQRRRLRSRRRRDLRCRRLCASERIPA